MLLNVFRIAEETGAFRSIFEKYINFTPDTLLSFRLSLHIQLNASKWKLTSVSCGGTIVEALNK